MATVRFDSSISLLSANIPVSSSQPVLCVMFFFLGVGGEREGGGDLSTARYSNLEWKGDCYKALPGSKIQIIAPQNLSQHSMQLQDTAVFSTESVSWSMSGIKELDIVMGAI